MLLRGLARTDLNDILQIFSTKVAPVEAVWTPMVLPCEWFFQGTDSSRFVGCKQKDIPLELHAPPYGIYFFIKPSRAIATRDVSPTLAIS